MHVVPSRVRLGNRWRRRSWSSRLGWEVFLGIERQHLDSATTDVFGVKRTVTVHRGVRASEHDFTWASAVCTASLAARLRADGIARSHERARQAMASVEAADVAEGDGLVACVASVAAHQVVTDTLYADLPWSGDPAFARVEHTWVSPVLGRRYGRSLEVCDALLERPESIRQGLEHGQQPCDVRLVRRRRVWHCADYTPV